ncbi:MAG TPA: prepilin-type N-terminal cleavage/methylation domain-containing protein [Candidatus Dormibacteraeota bacterium]|nr:prepilin-type N-terminal cleavage/methylation domain-containing protein [Candidatus Dormibacteraeota bacterium]
MNKSQHGFSLLELLVASSIGLTVILVMTSLFKTGMDATMKVTQRAETQQNLRAAVQLMTKDISLAGGGIPSGGLQLSSAGVSKFGCNQAGTCYVTGGTYPNSATGSPNYMYAIEPGFGTGVQNAAVITAAPGQTNSSITSVYCDYNFPLSNFTFAIPAAGTSATVGVINAAITPNNILAPGGLQVGDLILFTVSTPGNGKSASGTSLVQNAAVVAEVTGIPSNTALTFATGDALNFNFATGTNNLAAVASAAAGAGAQTSACRLQVVTYFLQVPVAGGTVQTPRLMRQVNGLNAVPVADNIINLQFTYDVIDSTTGTVVANQQNPIGAGESPSLIQKVNLWVMGTSLTTDGNRAQNMYLATAVSTRDMSFCNSYSSSTTACQ